MGRKESNQTNKITLNICFAHRKEENARRKYFMINLRESMGPGLNSKTPGTALGLTTNCTAGPGRKQQEKVAKLHSHHNVNVLVLCIDVIARADANFKFLFHYGTVCAH